MKKNQIYMIYGTNYREMAKEILKAVKVEDAIGSKNAKIGLKPNLVVASPADGGATTHPEILAGAIEYLQEQGFFDISIIEGSWVGDRTKTAFKVCGFCELERKYGVKLIDTQTDSHKSYSAKGMKIDICDSAMSVDYMINMPVLKGHCQTSVTCALKNNKGVIPNSEKRHFHTMGLHKPIAHLNTVAKNDLVLVDNICGDLDFEEGGNPVSMNRILAFADPVLCDSFACEVMGYTTEDVAYIGIAEALGVGSSDLSKAEIIELNKDRSAGNQAKSTRKIKALEGYINPSDACSACYGSLIHALDKLNYSGILDKLPDKIAIGQGYKGKTGEIGVGNCAAGFKCCVKGCPPKAKDIVDFLDSLM